MCGSVSGGMSSKLFGHLMSFSSMSYFCNQNTFNLQDWLILIACWSLIKIFCKNTLWKKHLLISKQQEDKGKTCFVQGWDVIPKQNAESHNNMIDSSSPFLNQLFWQYLCFSKHFRSHVILKMFGGQYSQWHSHLQTLFCSIEMVEDSTMTSHLFSGLYHLENSGCMGFVGVR
jgi:hypothetical protein